jgi:TonB-linked SusC/RagA family outer membrane protein
MKKRRDCFSPHGEIRKLKLSFKKMKLTLIFSMLVLLTFGNGFSQVKVTLRFEKASIQKVLETIENQTGYVFLYKDEIFNPDQKYSVDFTDEPFNEVIKSVCETAGVEYEVRSNRQIILTEKGQESLRNINFQQKTVTGMVTDSNGYPLPGVTVVVKGTTIGTVTNPDGGFSLSIPTATETLQFSFVGMKTQEVPIGDKTTFTIVMEDETIGMEEVVVVGYGTQKKVNMTGSVDVVSGEQLADRPAAQTAQLLQGQSASTLITNTMRGGEPGSGQSIQIRGTGSITGDAKPLVLVDGVEMDMNLVDPSSIESISVLKDASASAIYGSRAAFGVILIQTKKGSERAVRVSYSNITSLNVPYYEPDMLDSYTYATVFNQARANAGLSPTFGPEQVERIKGYIDGTYPYPYNPDQPPFNHWRGRWDGNANVNWGQEYFRPSVQQKHNFNVEGGNENVQFYTSIGYLNEPGIIRWGNDKYERYNILGNVSARATDWLKFDFSARYAKTITDRPNGGVWGDRSGYWMHFNILWPTMPMYNIDGSVHNPIMVALMDGGRVITQNNNARFAVGTEIEPVKGWKTFVKYNYDSRMGTTVNHMFPVETTIANGTTGNIGFAQSALYEELRTGHYMVFTAYSQYEKTIGDHNFSVMAGYEHDYDYNRNLIGEGAELITDEVPAISTALGTKVVYDQIYHWATQAGFGRITYNYREKYLLELNARYDGSSKFAPGQRWGFFPSGSVGYNIAREDFWAPLEPYIQILKLRASYGSLGNQTIRGPQLVQRGQSFEEVFDPNVTNYLYLEEIPIHQRLDRMMDGERPTYADMPKIASEYLTWETITTTNVGIDAGAFNNRLLLEFDWYKRITDDMIGPSVELPSVLGASAPTTNNAKLETKGFELSLEWRDKIKELSYNAKFSVGDYQTTILEYVNETGYVHGWYAGKKYGDVWGLTTDGLIQTAEEAAAMPDQSYYFNQWGPGDIKYVDTSDDGKIDPGQNTLDDHGDLSVIANTTPRYQFSITAGLKWKNWDVSMFWQGIAKQLFVPNSGSEYYWGHLHYPNSAILLKNSDHLDYWRPSDETNILGPNTDAFQPKPYFSSERNKNFQTQTRFIDNANYMRLKNLMVGYTIPQSLMSRIPIHSARIYFSGENLLTFQSLPKAFEPESMVSSNTFMRTYPMHQMYSFGLNITF